MTAESLPYDEMVSGKRSIRPHWRELMALVWGIPPDMMRERQARAASHLAAADQFLTESGDAPAQWGIDLLPLILPEAEWRVIAAGLAQRAKLLNMILSDIYGPQRLIHDKLLPPYLVFNNPGFLRPLRFVTGAGGAPLLHFYAADLVRMPGGEWRVLADRTQAAGGVGYALRHRSVAARSFPEAFRHKSLHRLQPTIDLWQSSLQSIGSKLDDNPRVVLLTPGPHNAAYPEHVLLAHELGITLAQGSDLTVREGMVYLKTLDGLVRIHVIYRRVDGAYCDPLELRPDSELGVAGLIAATRAGHVAILNLPGSAVLEAPAFAPFLPAIARHFLGEELALPAVTTWWCGQGGPLAEVLNAPDNFILQPSFSPDAANIDTALMSMEEKSNFLAKLKAAPDAYVAVQRVQHSRVPTLAEKGLEPQPVFFRAAAISHGETWNPMPGGVARVTSGEGQRQALRLGGLVKDVWILKDEPVADTMRGDGLVDINKLARVADAVSSRVADDLFWLGRYVERADSGLRQLRTATTRLIRGTLGPRETAELQLLARLLLKTGWIPEADALAPADSSIFAHSILAAATPDQPLAGYQTSLRQLGMAQRDRLSQEMWRVITSLGRVLLPDAKTADFDTLLAALDNAILNAATFNGLVAENMTRGMGWRFLDIGRRIERGIFICDAVDGLFGDNPARVELSVRLILELCDSVMTHRKRFPTDPYTLAALDLVLADGTNPRGLFFQLDMLRTELDGLIGHDPLAAEKLLVSRNLEALRGAAAFANPDAANRLDALSGGARSCAKDLADLSDALSRSFFSHVKATPTVVLGLGDRKAAS